ncbi:MAG: MFS transporter, partial [Deltaproteobacteria bacterium]|nr:MFS transporter [Deltaproteobacteria bacterium]
MSIFTRLLAKRDYWPLFGTMTLGAFNDNFMRQAMIAMLAYVTVGLTPADRSVMGSLATGLMVLPFFLFSSVAGELADRYRKSSIVKINKGFEFAVMLLAAVFFAFQSVAGLFVVIFLMGTQTAFFGPVKYGILPEIVEPDELMAANGLFSGATYLAIVLGTTIGFYLVTTPLGPHLLMPISLIVVGGLSFFFALRQPRSELVNPDLKIDPLLFRSTAKILQAARSDRGIWLSMLAMGWFWGMGSVLLSQMPVLSATVMGAKPEVGAAMVTMFAVGIAVGSLLVNKLAKGQVTVTMVPASAALMTVFLLAFAYAISAMPAAKPLSFGFGEFVRSPHHLAIAALCLLISLSGGVFVVPLIAYIQRQAQPGQRARIIAADNIVTSAFMVVASLLVTLMFKVGFSIAEVFVFIGATAVLMTAMTVYFLPAAAFRCLLRIVLRVIFKPKVSGQANLETVLEGPALVICNHQSFADVALLVAYIPRSLTFAIDVYRAQAWWVRFFTSFYKTIPLNPAQPIGARDLISALDNGEMLVIFPEGRLNDNGEIMKIYDGAALVASKAKCPLLPVILQDMEYTSFGRLGKLRRH